MLRKVIAAGVALGITLGLSSVAAADPVTLNIGTLAPKDSRWGKVFTAWTKALAQETSDGVALNWYWNGSQGDERAMVGKMRNGQLDGAAITSTGLSQIYPHYEVWSLPGIFPHWENLDRARNALRSRFDAEFAKQNFTVMGVGDVGIAHLMSKGDPVKVPDDLKTRRPVHIQGDPVSRAFLQIVGAKPVPLEVPAIYASLNTDGGADVINAPSLAAEQLQWAPKLDSINTMPTGMGVGALVFFSGPDSKYNALPADAKAAVARTGKNAGDLLTQSIRQLDDQAFQRLKGRMKVYDPSEAELAQWRDKFTATRNALRGSAIAPDIMDAVVQAAQ
jgi:TRAP-type C4-dicarboxylate transport system substrate-binding protein